MKIYIRNTTVQLTSVALAQASPNYVIHVFSIKPCLLTLFVEDCNNIKYYGFSGLQLLLLAESYYISALTVTHRKALLLINYMKKIMIT